MNIEKAQSSTPASALAEVASSQASSVGGAPSPGTPASLLPAPDTVLLSGDMGAAIAALAVQQGNAEEQTETQAAEAQDTLQDNAEAAQVATLHSEASTMRAGAWESGLLQIGAGVCTMGSAGVSMGTGGSATGGQIATLLKGAGEGVTGAGTIVGGLSKAAATDLDASATASKALADAAGRAGDLDRDAHKSAESFVQAALDFYREYAQAKAQAEAAALHGA
jgi:hypothetical protein